MNEKTEGRLARWSRLKRARRDREERGSGVAIAPGEAPVGAVRSPLPETPRRPLKEAPPTAITDPELPSITELNKDSDFTPYLRVGVPEGLHREALRALWRSDPAFAFRDGLTDYDEDYTAIGMVEQVVRTAYQAGQGYLDETAPPPEGRVTEEGEAVAAVSKASSATEAPSVEATPTGAADRSDDDASGVSAEPSPTSPVVRNGC